MLHTTFTYSLLPKILLILKVISNCILFYIFECFIVYINKIINFNIYSIIDDFCEIESVIYFNKLFNIINDLIKSYVYYKFCIFLIKESIINKLFNIINIKFYSLLYFSLFDSIHKKNYRV